jgi:serine/threonine-protein kinase
MPPAPSPTSALDPYESRLSDDTATFDVDPLAGTQYRAVARLGVGGMGEVFLADHVELGRRFVVKLLHASMAESARLVDRMRIEAQALARLEHPHIVEVNNFGKTPAGRPFIVMERLRGATLADELRQRGVFSVHETLRLVRQLLSALSAAHDIGLVHRDIKLSNLFLHQAPGQPPILKVLDFGIAKVIEGISPNAPRPLLHPTEEGVVLGTPRYMSPEAILALPVDHRSDLYSVGLVLYTLLAGRGPWHHQPDDRQVLAAQVREQPEPLSEYVRDVPAELERAIMKLLEKRPEQRFQSARELDAVLAAIERGLPRGASSERGLPRGASSERGLPRGASSERGLARGASSERMFDTDVGASSGTRTGETVPDIEPTQPAETRTLAAPHTNGAPHRADATRELSSSEVPVPLPVNDLPTRTAIDRRAGSRTTPARSEEPTKRAAAVRRTIAKNPTTAGLLIAALSTLLAWWLIHTLLRILGAE